MKIILASKSPRRKELLSCITENFEVIVSDVDEKIDDGLSIEEQAKRISYIKAKTVFNKTSGDRIVIGSDTMVVKDGKIFGKPKDFDDAFNMLTTLKNTNHKVITGIAILVQKDGKYEEYIDYDTAIVYFKDMTNEEITNWINSKEAYDKAGAYAIQGKFMIHIDKLEGNFSTVMGLPVHKVYEILKKLI